MLKVILTHDRDIKNQVLKCLKSEFKSGQSELNKLEFPVSIQFHVDKLKSHESLITYSQTGFNTTLDWDPVNKQHYQNLFEFQTLSRILRLLKSDPNTKRAMLNFWKPEFEDANLTAPSLIYVHFRLLSKKLYSFFHMRSNNLSLKTEINFLTFLAVHKYFQNELHYPEGEIFYLVDLMKFDTN